MTDEKVSHKVEEMTGAVKKNVGDATDNESLEAEGRREQSAAKAKQAGDSMKDAAGHALDSAKDAIDR